LSFSKVFVCKQINTRHVVMYVYFCVLFSWKK